MAAVATGAMCLLFAAGPFQARGSDYEIVLDVEDPCFEVLAGDWYLPAPKMGAYLGSFYLAIDGPGTGSARARWTAEGLPAGDYRVEFYSDAGAYPTDAQFSVKTSTETARVTRDLSSGGWIDLGVYAVDRFCTVTVTDQWTGGGSVLRVDAIRLTLQTAIPAPPAGVVGPFLGICIDDVGSVDPSSPGTPIYRMLRLPYRMTFAVLPDRTWSTASAEEIHRHGSEVFLHQPMGYIGNPNPSGAEWIRANMTPAQAREVLARNLDALPHTTGANNHTGSQVTQDTAIMAACMEELRSRELFWLDSRTFTRSVACDAAREAGVLTGERDLFIDGSSVEESKERIRSLALRALHAPTVPHLAIGHVRDNTAQALEEMAGELAEMGVEIRPVSRWMTQVIERDMVPAAGSIAVDGAWLTDPADRLSKELVDGDAMAAAEPGVMSTAQFVGDLPSSAIYDVFLTWTGNGTTVSGDVVVCSAAGTGVPQAVPSSWTDWMYVGRHPFHAGTAGSIAVRTTGAGDDAIMADAIKLVHVSPWTPRPEILSLR